MSLSCRSARATDNFHNLLYLYSRTQLALAQEETAKEKAQKAAERLKIEELGKAQAVAAGIAATIDAMGLETLDQKERARLISDMLARKSAEELLRAFPQHGILIANGGLNVAGSTSTALSSSGPSNSEAVSSDLVAALRALQVQLQQQSGGMTQKQELAPEQGGSGCA